MCLNEYPFKYIELVSMHLNKNVRFCQFEMMRHLPDQILRATSPETHNKISITKNEHAFCFHVAGASARIITSPFAVVKFFLQTKQSPLTASDIVSILWMQSGISGFWRGMSTLFFNPQFAIKFTLTEQLQKKKNPNKSQIMQNVAIDAFTSFVSQMVGYPTALIHSRMMDNPWRYHSFIQSVKAVINEEGLASLWNGFKIQAISTIPFQTTQSWIYQVLKQRYLLSHPNKKMMIDLPPGANVIFSGIACGISQFTFYPIDVVMKRMMINQDGENLSMGQLFKKIYKEEGFAAFYRGALVSSIKIIPFNAIRYTIFVELKKLLIQYKVRRMKDSNNYQK